MSIANIIDTWFKKFLNGDETTFFIHSKMPPVYLEDLPQGVFFVTTAQLHSPLHTYAAEQNGWNLEKIVELETRFAVFGLIGSLYLHFRTVLHGIQCLLSNRNREHHECFFCCVTAI